MNIDEMIEVMQAFRDGKKIQYKWVCVETKHGFVDINDDWHDTNESSWNWYNCEYRIKPEPRIFYMNEYEDGGRFLHDSKSDAKRTAHSGAIRVAVPLKEVVE